ncbi:tubulin--tyrosine ligase-like protein 12 isoform X2 [Anabrus simplex]|uniref:tubulin--tyrosine ligase-like protein 12 isoform X2 n=1 Tax=Anabrus simplex TaxID=316456 RepID=UPI0034DDB7E4
MEVKDGVCLFKRFVSLHKSQLESSGVPGHFWEILSKKLINQALDAGDTFSILKIEYDGEYEDSVPQNKVVVSCEGGVKKDDPKHIYLIDHAWTFSVDKARDHLREIPGLGQRMAKMMNIPCSEDEEIPSDDLIEAVFNEMWRYSQTYAVGAISDVEDRLPIWYIMDEFGSAIQHSNDPTFRTIPLIYLPEGVTYTLLFPIKDVPKGGEVTRDYVEGPFHDELTRKALLLPWIPASFASVSFKQEEPGEAYFLEGHVAESLPNLGNFVNLQPENREKLTVFAEYKYIHNYLTHPRFVITEDENSADILWYTKHFKCYEEFSEVFPDKYVNQFPYEHVITVKDLLSIVCRRKAEGTEGYNMETLETQPLWLPTTFNLTTELPKFVSYYQHRKIKGLDNHWICKPFNLARGLDTHITSNLNYIVRLPCTGPKIAQKYIEDPVLFHRPEIGTLQEGQVSRRSRSENKDEVSHYRREKLFGYCVVIQGHNMPY